ncbi:AraC family transcriptional regulator [Dietzia sp. oral taxon 368]|uniref:AraC family transcriptional regulator n=1 Tax=Dietzia sp. oral taxon 368 TaxID=712270 RepID=UPI000D093AB8|nr:AraC family transcriptional regulator [Dietzia sp. oral taxon 368]AVM63933.1 AraC family transcriptional regulator [Dietzia sp. oral taxon 368]
MAFIRSAGLRGVRAVVAGLGGDADDLARRSGLPHGALDSDEMLVEDLAIALLLETAAAELQCPDLGLRVAEHQDLDMLGPVAMVVKNARTTTAALEMTSKYLFFHSRSIEITVVPDSRGEPDVVGVRFGYRDPAQLIPPQAVDLVLLFLHRAMRTVLGGDYGLLSVELPGPLNTDAAQYKALFGAPVTPSTPSAVLRVPSDLLGREISGGDDAVQQLALRYLEQHVPTDRRSLTDRTRAALQQSLDAGASSLARIAGLLSMSPRSLQRGLAGEGTSFSAVRDEVRREVAARLLTTTEIPLYQIASALDLGDATTFSQYARRWWGMTAREVRHGYGGVGQSTP